MGRLFSRSSSGQTYRRSFARVFIAAGLVCLVIWAMTGAAQLLSSPAVSQNFANVRPEEPSRHKLRARRFLAGRDSAGGQKSAEALTRARQQHLALTLQPRATSLASAWEPVGPAQIGSLAYGNVTGRITSIAIDPYDATGNTVYIGTTGGGVWKSTNAAGPSASVQFQPLTDTLPVFSLDSGNSAIASLSIGALSVANGIVLAGTGDPNDALDSYYGSGLLRSADDGATWTLVQESHDGANGNHSFIGLGFAGFAWSTATPTTVVAAVSDAAEGVIVNAADTTYSVRGLYYSQDSGVTWQMATIKDGSQTVQAPASAGENQGGNAVTSVVWNPVRQMFYAAVRYHGYYESADGSVWRRLAAQPGTGLTSAACPANHGTVGSTGCPIFRGALAVQPASGDTFAFTVDINNLDHGIWRDVCAASNSACTNPQITFATQFNTASLEQSSGSTAIFQGDYNLSLAAVASGADTLVFAGTVDVFRCSLAAGCVFRNTTNAENGCAAPAMVAPAQHAIAALATASLPLLYFGNDGGLWRSTDGVNQQASPCSADDASHFQNLNGGIGSLAEVVSFAQHPSDADTLLVGVGANGTAATSSAAADQLWPQLAEGEGGFTAIDPANPSNWYISTAAGVSITHCAKGAGCAAADFAGQPTVGATQVANDASLIDPPWLLDPASTTNVAIGTCRVWRGPAQDGSAWTAANALSTDFGTTESAVCSTANSFVRSLAAGGPVSSTAAGPNAGSEVLYAGLAGTLDGGGSLAGHLFATAAGNTAGPATAWTDLALSPVTNAASDGYVFNPGGFDISSVAVDPHDPTGKTLYATVMGFANNGINAPHLYRSTDGGADWTNISSNLPNAPANSVAVDPNDANTVYVAMDTGVYATTQVTSCTMQNCWDVLGVSLPNAPVVELAAAAAMPTGEGTQGVLRAGTYGRGIWQISLLTAAVATAPAITLSPSSLSFPAQGQGSLGAAQSITMTNSGSAALTISSVTASGDFRETDTCAGRTVAIGGSCSVSVTFLPSATGTRTGVLTVYGNVSGGQATASLTGIGAAPAAVVLDPLNLDFGTVPIGSTTASQNITVSNTGGVPATLQQPVVSGDFQMTADTCGATLAPGSGCTLSIVFTPTASGTRNGSVMQADSAGTQAVSLTGVGASLATDTLAPLTLNFPQQYYGTVSAAQTVTLSNNGDTALTLIAVQSNSADFTVVNGCGSTLAGHSACVVQIAFSPQRNGPITGTVTVSDQLRSQTIALSGIGVAPPLVQVAPTTLSFPGTGIGKPSAAQTVTVSNIGGGTLVIAKIAITGDFTETDNCGGKSLSGSASCSVQVTFTPTVSGARAGTLTVSGSGVGQQAITMLSGDGLAPAAIVLDPTSLSFGTVLLGATSPALNITISNTGDVPAALSTFNISGPFKITANTCGTSLPGSTGCTVAIVFAPTVSGAASGSFVATDSTGTQTAALTGAGASPATDSLAPLSLSFAPTQLGSSSATQQVTLTNSGDTTLTLISAQITSGFAEASACGPMLIGHSSCIIAVAATPQVLGAYNGVLSVSDQFRTQTVALSSTGTAPAGVSLSPIAGLTFAATGVGQSSAPQTVTLANQDASALAISGIAATGDFSVPAATNACGSSVAPGGTCTFQVVFSPTAVGVRTGMVSVTDNAATSPQTLQLQGTGIDFAFATEGPTSITISSGESAVFGLLISSDATETGSAALTCTGAPLNSTCVIEPANPTLGSASVITVTIQTGVSASSAALIAPSRKTQGIAVAILLPSALSLLIFGWRRPRDLRSGYPFLLCVVVIAGLLCASGCGSGRTIPPATITTASPNPTPTPAGTYPITVAATSAGLTRTITLTLIVQ
jgi:hypothetical protein